MEGNTHFTAGKYFDAINSYTKAIKLLPFSDDLNTYAWYLQRQPESINVPALFRYCVMWCGVMRRGWCALCVRE